MRFHQFVTREVIYRTNSKSKTLDGFKPSFAPHNAMIVVIVKITNFLKPGTAIPQCQLQLALENCPHRLAIEQCFGGSYGKLIDMV